MYLYFVFIVSFRIQIIKKIVLYILQGRNLFLGLILISYCYYKTIKGFH